MITLPIHPFGQHFHLKLTCRCSHVLRHNACCTGHFYVEHRKPTMSTEEPVLIIQGGLHELDEKILLPISTGMCGGD